MKETERERLLLPYVVEGKRGYGLEDLQLERFEKGEKRSGGNLPIISFDEGYIQIFRDDNLILHRDGKSTVCFGFWVLVSFAICAFFLEIFG